MYESHFGLKGSPFQLNPDPAFYYASRGHGSALGYLKFGAHQGEGFIVVTGEIGAGKTTLVKTLLESLDPARLVAAQVVSTQLEAGDLLRTILTAFGVAPTGATKAHLIATLEGFLTAVAAKGRRALLIVDEAQNLDRNAVEELRMLSNYQLGNQALLQSFLVGQPELRVLLQSKSMEQLRQRVIASCHLGPLDPPETRAYIEHRLHHVGWAGNPAFDDEAHGRIHHWTGGIPRRINRLCNRLMLGAYLADQNSITAESVDRTATDLGTEIGESITPPAEMLPTGPSSSAKALAPRRLLDAGPIEVRLRTPSKPAAPLICLVDSLLDYLKAGALAEAFAMRPSLPSIVAVHMGQSSELAIDPQALKPLPLPSLDLHLGVSAVRGASVAALALTRFEAVLDEYAACAVLSIGQSDAVLACALLAHKREVPLLRANAGRRRPWSSAPAESNAALMDHFSDVLYSENLATHYTLHRVGISSERVHSIGDLASNLVHCAQAAGSNGLAANASRVLAEARVRGDVGFALVTKQFHPDRTPAAHIVEAVSMLTAARAEVPLVWAVDPDTMRAIEHRASITQLAAAGVDIVPGLAYVDSILLVGRARFVIAGPEARFVDEARALGLPSLVIDHGLVAIVRVSDSVSPGTSTSPSQFIRLVKDFANEEEDRQAAPEFWDGGPASRIAAHFDAWLRRYNRSRIRLLPEPSRSMP